MTERCLRCLGSKKISPMGGIAVTCNICAGVGFVEPLINEPYRVVVSQASTEEAIKQSMLAANAVAIAEPIVATNIQKVITNVYYKADGHMVKVEEELIANPLKAASDLTIATKKRSLQQTKKDEIKALRAEKLKQVIEPQLLG